MDYRTKSRCQLEAEMKRLQRDLEDLEEAIGVDLINTSAHISGRQVQKDEACLSELRERIDAIRKFLESANM